MLKPLHARLATTLLILLLLTGALSIASTLVTTELYMREATQSLNLGLARQIAMAKHETLLDEHGEIRAEGLDQLFHWLMVVNPSVAFYVLDRTGQVIAYDPMPGEISHPRVDLGPVRKFARRQGRLPILGDDPRGEQPRIFSVSPLPAEGEARGYLYIVLASEPLGAAAGLLRSSHILRLSIWMLLGSLGFAAVAGWLLFRHLTRPLRQLAERIRTFGREPEEPGRPSATRAGDEVAFLSQTFDDMAERIQCQMEEVERIEASRRELVANVSHDLRTPITGLRGYLDTLVLKRGKLSDEENERYLNIALRQSERLGKLVDELFQLAKLDNHAVQPNMESFSLGELVHDNLQRFQMQAEEKNIDLKAELDLDLPFVRADLGLVERVLENLLENALRYTPEGGSVSVRLTPEDGQIRVAVIDSGCGIAGDALPRIFDRFYRLNGDAKHPSEGTGLGLAITKRILDLHGSRVEVHSRPGQGSVFAFPLAVAGN